MPIETGLIEKKKSNFVPRHESLAAVMADHELAALGDAYINFVYSLAVSRRLGKPVGRKVNSSLLAAALKKAGLRRSLPSRLDRHGQADAAEALIVYAWLMGLTSLDETVSILEKGETDEDTLAMLLQEILKRTDLAHEKV